MLYTGTGDRGHWRSLVNEGGKMVVYNDEMHPVNVTKNDLKNGTDFIYVIGNQKNKIGMSRTNSESGE